MYLKEKISFKGEWFLPSQQDQRLVGELTYDPSSGSMLKVHGNFSGDILSTSHQTYDIIIGFVEGSRYITLYNVFLVNSGRVSFVKDAETSLPNCTYCVNYFFVDFAATCVENLSFTAANVHFHNLDEWLGISGFGYSYDSWDRTKKKATIQYKLPKPIEFSLPYTGTTAKFDIAFNGSPINIFNKEVILTQRTYFRLDFETDRSLDDIQKLVSIFQQFLILGTYQGTYIDSFTLIHKECKKPILFYFNSSSLDTYKLISPMDALFNYGVIRKNFSKIITRWYELCEKMDGVLWLYTERFLDEKHFSVNDFLNMAQVVESFHSLLYNHPRENAEKYKARVRRIVDQVSKKDQEFVKSKLAQGNNLILAERLKELANKCPSDVLSIFIADVDTFLKQVRDSRNYYTHYTKSGKKHVVEGAGLIRLTEQLKLLLTCNILVYLKFSKQQITKIIENKKYQFGQYK